MGAGKTTVGRKLAGLLQCKFIDTDRALEKRTGVSVSHIFEIEGENGFREREAKLLAQIVRNQDRNQNQNQNQNQNHNPPAAAAVIATGGGIILRERNRQVMRQSGTVVYLRATPDLLWSRLKDCHTRPLLIQSGPDAKNTIAQLLEERGPLYAAAADLIVDARAESAGKMAREIHALLQTDDAAR